MVIEKAKRLVEHKRDVVILLDSITRLARAYNTVVPPSGKILSGGVDSNALHKPKRFFGAARNIEEGGSPDHHRHRPGRYRQPHGRGHLRGVQGHRQHGTHLDRKLVDKRIFPAIDIKRSGTRKEELLIPKTSSQRTWILRRVINPLSPVEAMELLTDKLAKTRITRSSSTT